MWRQTGPFSVVELGGELRICSQNFYAYKKKFIQKMSECIIGHRKENNNSKNSTRTQTQAHRSANAAATYSFDFD